MSNRFVLFTWIRKHSTPTGMSLLMTSEITNHWMKSIQTVHMYNSENVESIILEILSDLARERKIGSNITTGTISWRRCLTPVFSDSNLDVCIYYYSLLNLVLIHRIICMPGVDLANWSPSIHSVTSTWFIQQYIFQSNIFVSLKLLYEPLKLFIHKSVSK